MHVTITCHSDGSISAKGFKLTAQDMKKGYRVELGEGYTLRCTRSRGPTGNDIPIANISDPLGKELYAVNIGRQGIYTLNKRGYTYQKVSVPAPKHVPT